MPDNGSSSANLKPNAINALRDLVYGDVLSFLPPASTDQAKQFMANLALPREAIWKFLNLRVSPGLGETAYRGAREMEALQMLEERYAERITLVAGFYRDRRGRVCWTVPRNCALYGYRSQAGLLNGILCQPLYTIDVFWLLTSAKFAGPKALRLSDHDAALFEAGLVTYPAWSPQAKFARREALARA